MPMKFSGVIRRWMGWCPNAAATGTGRRRYAAPDGEIGLGTAAGGSREVVEGAFVDYVSPRFLPVSILVFGGLFVLFVVGFLSPSLRPGFYILMGLSFIAYAAVHLYFDTKRAEIDSSGDSIVVRRSRSRPLVFGKDAFRSVEVKRPYPPLLRGALAVLLILLVAGVYFFSVWVGWMRYPGALAVDLDFAFHAFFEVGFAVFMLELLYRSLVGLRYPGHVRVTLEPAGFLNVYTDDPERVATLLDAPQ
ncbi:DUF1673 family protein [Methanoculleus sp.]|jgi:hypothetical protein|uniref:DUF1673 family protein n=1 Tax=Methanoculleus sp. TaxID=90427 RepID=UPI001BD6BC3B|nr:DUF1673 family protein [Methanoculleus sp.]